MTNSPRLYGAADPDSDQSPTEQGMRGERNGPRSGVTPPRAFTGADGRPIAVQETSGVAGVEAARDAPDGDSADDA